MRANNIIDIIFTILETFFISRLTRFFFLNFFYLFFHLLWNFCGTLGESVCGTLAEKSCCKASFALSGNDADLTIDYLESLICFETNNDNIIVHTRLVYDKSDKLNTKSTNEKDVR